MSNTTATAFTLRIDNDVLVQLDAMAAGHRISRNAYVGYLVRRAIDEGFVPLSPGEGFDFLAPSGGGGSFVLSANRSVPLFGTTYHLTEQEQDVVKEAQQLAEEGWWAVARSKLTQAGFTLTPIKARDWQQASSKP